MSDLELMSPADLAGLSKKVADACKDIVEKTAIEIQKRRYVKVEGWQAIANGFGCVGSARNVEKVFDPADDRFLGFRAIGEVRRLKDMEVISTGEGFVGVDEPRWFGGKSEVWDREKRKMVTKEFKPAPEYSVRAMVQTRAISRACRGAFAFIIVLIGGKKEYSTTPAEEVGDDEPGHEKTMKPAKTPEQAENADAWRNYTCTYGTKGGPLRGKQLGELTDANLEFVYGKFVASGQAVSPQDQKMVEGLKLWKDWFDSHNAE